jgi:hypothetical protein
VLDGRSARVAWTCRTADGIDADLSFQYEAGALLGRDFAK